MIIIESKPRVSFSLNAIKLAGGASTLFY